LGLLVSLQSWIPKSKRLSFPLNLEILTWFYWILQSTQHINTRS
jgi:hypothetical protein